MCREGAACQWARTIYRGTFRRAPFRGRKLLLENQGRMEQMWNMLFPCGRRIVKKSL